MRKSSSYLARFSLRFPLIVTHC